MTKLRFLPDAELELLREVAYYAKARSGVGMRFQAAVEAAAKLAMAHPLGGAPSFADTRSVLVRGFPFSLVYRATPDEVLVVAIAPHRKRPQYWASRVK